MSKKKSLDVYKNWKRIPAAVNDLYLDPQNVRLDFGTSEGVRIDQGSIINDLFANEDAFQILESVVDDGWFVDELPIVIKEKNKVVVVEGNRRIAALKVLQNPLLAPSYHQKIKPLSESVIPLEQVEVLLAPSRNEVNNLLANKHTTTTRRPWKPLRQAHFYHSQLSKNTSIEDLKRKYKGVDIASFMRMHEIHTIASSYDLGDVEKNNKVRKQRTFPISTVERLYDDSNFRDYLNFNFDDNGKIKINSSKNKFDAEFKKVILDTVNNNINTRFLNTEENRKSYFSSRLNKLKKSAQKTTSSKYTPKAPVRRKRSSAVGLFDSSIICTINCRGVERVYEELQKINYGDGKFPNAAHDLLRSFLEAVLKEYLKKKRHKVSASRQGGYVYLKDILNEAENYFRQMQNHQIRQVLTAIKNDKEFLDSINHNPSIFSTQQKVKDAADQMSDLIKFVFEDYKK